MKKIIFLFLLAVSICSYAQDVPMVEISFLGTFHFDQVHNPENSNTNFFEKDRQSDIQKILSRLKLYQPDRIYIEREPKFQNSIDSIYQLYKVDKLQLRDLRNGSGEVYQLAFQLAKELDLPAPLCVNYYASTSQSLLSSGKNIEKYQMALQDFQQLGRSTERDFIQGKASLLETLLLMNTPENLAKSYRLLFNIPAYVKNGEFVNYDKVDSTSIDKNYIGAEFISLLYERNLKIYSNILNTQQDNGGKRILMITGQTHVGVLQELLHNNTNFRVIPIHTYLKN